MACDIERWKWVGGRTATLAKTKQELLDVQQEISRLKSQHTTQTRGADIWGWGGGGGSLSGASGGSWGLPPMAC